MKKLRLITYESIVDMYSLPAQVPHHEPSPQATGCKYSFILWAPSNLKNLLSDYTRCLKLKNNNIKLGIEHINRNIQYFIKLLSQFKRSSNFDQNKNSGNILVTVKGVQRSIDLPNIK